MSSTLNSSQRTNPDPEILNRIYCSVNDLWHNMNGPTLVKFLRESGISFTCRWSFVLGRIFGDYSCSFIWALEEFQLFLWFKARLEIRPNVFSFFLSFFLVWTRKEFLWVFRLSDSAADKSGSRQKCAPCVPIRLGKCSFYMELEFLRISTMFSAKLWKDSVKESKVTLIQKPWRCLSQYIFHLFLRLLLFLSWIFSLWQLSHQLSLLSSVWVFLTFVLVGWISKLLLLEPEHQHHQHRQPRHSAPSPPCLSARRPAAKPNLSCCEAAAVGIILMAVSEAKSLWTHSSARSCWSSLTEFWVEFMMRGGNLLTFLLYWVESCNFLSCCMCRSLKKSCCRGFET